MQIITKNYYKGAIKKLMLNETPEKISENSKSFNFCLKDMQKKTYDKNQIWNIAIKKLERYKKTEKLVNQYNNI